MSLCKPETKTHDYRNLWRNKQFRTVNEKNRKKSEHPWPKCKCCYHVVYFNFLNCHRREDYFIWESGCKLFIGCIWTQKSDWWRRSTGFLFLDSLSAIKLSQTYRMYAQFALVEHSGTVKKVLIFVKKSATLSQVQTFLSAESGKQFHVAPCSSSQNS